MLSSFATGLVVTGFLAAACAAVEPKQPDTSAREPEVVARSPRGTFRIEHRWRRDPKGEPSYTYDSFIVPEKASDAAATPLESNVEPVRHYRISPDERWIHAEFKCYTRRSSCELFERRKGFRFAKVFTQSDDDGGNFDAAMWKFFARTTGLEPAEYPRLCDFVAWAPDSSRLLVALRGVATPKSWKPDPDAQIESAPGIYGWKVYWNTRKHAFELTKMLKEDNKQAAKRWTDEGRGPDLREPFCAEPVEPLPSLENLDRQLAELQTRIEQAWTEEAASKREQGSTSPDADARPWPEIENAAAAWRQARISEMESAATRFAQRCPAKVREQWRRLALLGGLEVILEEVRRGWPWSK